MTNLVSKACMLLTMTTLISTMSAVSAEADVFAIITSQAPTGGVKSLGSVAGKLNVSTLKRGDTLIVYDGTNQKIVTEITIPMDEHFQSEIFRKSYLRKKFGPVIKFIKASKDKTSVVTDNNLTGLFREFADNVRSKYPEQSLRVLITGSVLYHDNRQPGYSMRGGAYPKDGHFIVDGFASPYGTADRPNALGKTRFHFCNPDDTFQSALHSGLLHRAWSLYIAKLGGTLATLTQDYNLCLARFLADNDPARTFTIDPDPGKPVMAILSPKKQISTLERGTKALKDIAIDEFTVFATAPHPWMVGVEVTTGIKYRASSYPNRFENSWCYFFRFIGGVSVRINVGRMDFGGKPKWQEPSKGTLISAKISRTNVIEARDACQLPVT